MYATQQALSVIDMWLRAQGCDVRDYILYVGDNPQADLRSLANMLEIEKCLATIETK